jgi:hypothetical protein
LGRFVVYYVYTKGKKGNPMQTAHADRQTPARGIVVALYRGKVVEWWRDTAVARWGAGRAQGRPGARARVRAREAESWRKLAES